MSWVNEELTTEGYFEPKKLQEREGMKAKKRRQLANSIVDQWQTDKVIVTLYRELQGTLEAARNKSTSGRGRK